jgi:hypothetical protein
MINRFVYLENYIIKIDMEHEILDLIDRHWKFDNDQTPVSNWHDKQDLLEAVRKALRIHDVVGRSEQLPTDEDCVNAIKKQLNDNGFKTD